MLKIIQVEDYEGNQMNINVSQSFTLYGMQLQCNYLNTIILVWKRLENKMKGIHFFEKRKNKQCDKNEWDWTN